jgi:hypothetical protein
MELTQPRQIDMKHFADFMMLIQKIIFTGARQ